MKFKEPEALNSVSEFHKTFHSPILDTPQIPEGRKQLRISLLREELKELEQAIEDNDIVEVADALCDLQYVLSGCVLEFGLGEKFKELFDEVQRSNMSKACKNYNEAQATLWHYRDKGTECHMQEQPDGTFLIYRDADSKTLKSLSYSSANLKGILEK